MVNRVLNHCPVCGGSLVVTRLACSECDTTIEGRFLIDNPFAQLNPEQVRFIELFIRSEGKLNRMEDELNLSYPTIRNRLNEIIRLLGFEPGAAEEPAGLSDSERLRILQAIDAGELSVEQAMHQLQEGAS